MMNRDRERTRSSNQYTNRAGLSERTAKTESLKQSGEPESGRTRWKDAARGSSGGDTGADWTAHKGGQMASPTLHSQRKRTGAERNEAEGRSDRERDWECRECVMRGGEGEVTTGVSGFPVCIYYYIMILSDDEEDGQTPPL